MHSRDCLFFIRHRLPTDSTTHWYLVQIDLDATSPHLAKTMGSYVAQWYTPNATDRLTKPLTHCRFWPDVRRTNNLHDL